MMRRHEITRFPLAVFPLRCRDQIGKHQWLWALILNVSVLITHSRQFWEHKIQQLK